LFPLAFIFFNIIYWTYYTKWSVVEHPFEHWMSKTVQSLNVENCSIIECQTSLQAFNVERIQTSFLTLSIGGSLRTTLNDEHAIRHWMWSVFQDIERQTWNIRTWKCKHQIEHWT
jgi:hypothetical protein